jgi:hypothetical protein
MSKLIDVIEAHDFGAGINADREFVSTVAAFFALAISRLPPAEREHTLGCIEGGALRRAVLKYPGARPSSPFHRVSNGNGHA